MINSVERLSQWIVDTATLIASGREPLADEPPQFLETPKLIPALLQMIAAIDENTLKENQPLYSACLFGLDTCVSQLHFAIDNGNKRARSTMDQLMDQLATVIQKSTQSINFWLPILTSFYEAGVVLSPALQDMYLVLAEEEGDAMQGEPVDHLQSMRDLIEELSDLSAFELASHFFAQSHAMPADFFADLVTSLCQIETGHEAAILTLLHPQQVVREMVVLALDDMLPTITLSPTGLSRLQAIQAWYPEAYQKTMTRWVRNQRKKGVVFATPMAAKITKLQGSEIDGGGAEGLFLQLKSGRATRLAGLLFKDGFGIKDAWITPGITVGEVTKYCRDVLNDGVILRRIDADYMQQMTNHFLAMTLERGDVPSLHFLEFQEALGIHFVPEPLNVSEVLETLKVQVEPFTPAVIEAALKRSGNWLRAKRFAASWYLESEQIDKRVNQNCYFSEGTKVCSLEKAMEDVFQYCLNPARSAWVFHFLWVALWLKAGARKNEKTWQDSVLLAHAIDSGMPLKEIPLMQEICHQSVLNSIETMQDRRTHLN